MKLADLLFLKPNWDTYGGLRITKEAVDAAQAFLDEKPTVAPMSNGGVCLEWWKTDVMVCFNPDGTIEEDG